MKELLGAVMAQAAGANLQLLARAGGWRGGGRVRASANTHRAHRAAEAAAAEGGA